MMLASGVVDLVARWEGLHRVRRDGLVYPYLCPAGYWTQGYGRLVAEDSPPITRQQAGLWLLEDLDRFQTDTLRLCPVLLAEPDARLAAITSFTFNLGVGRLRASTLRRRLNERDWSAAAHELRRWVWAGGRKLPGLIARREEEARMVVDPEGSWRGDPSTKTSRTAGGTASPTAFTSPVATAA